MIHCIEFNCRVWVGGFQLNVSSYAFGMHISNINVFTSFSLIYSSKKRSLVFSSAHLNWIGEHCYIPWRYKTNKDNMPRSHKMYWCSKVVYAEILHRYMVMCRLRIDEGPQISTKRICRWIFSYIVFVTVPFLLYANGQ